MRSKRQRKKKQLDLLSAKAAKVKRLDGFHGQQVRKFEKEKEVKTMKIKIERLPSGFYCVRVNGQWIDAASANLEQAKAKANEVIQAVNKRQNKRNLFTNISLEIAL